MQFLLDVVRAVAIAVVTTVVLFTIKTVGIFLNLFRKRGDD